MRCRKKLVVERLKANAHLADAGDLADGQLRDKAADGVHIRRNHKLPIRLVAVCTHLR